MSDEIDPDFLKRLQTAAEIDPAKLVGSEIELAGQTYEIFELIRAGAQMVVFGLKHIATGKSDLVIKIPRTSLDPQAQLQKIICEELSKGEDMDPARMIAVCDKLLSLFPTDGVAAFNRGAAWFHAKNYDKAIESFDLAISIEPYDLWNWLQKAACLAECQRDSECLECVQVAGEFDASKTREYLEKARELRRMIDQALDRLIQAGGETKDAMNARKAYIT